MWAVAFDKDHTLALFVGEHQLDFIDDEGRSAGYRPRLCGEGILGSPIHKAAGNRLPPLFDPHRDHGAALGVDLNNQ
jgi:hypothetical protein